MFSQLCIEPRELGRVPYPGTTDHDIFRVRRQPGEKLCRWTRRVHADTSEACELHGVNDFDFRCVEGERMDRTAQRDEPWRELPVKQAVGDCKVRSLNGPVAPVRPAASRSRVAEVLDGERAEKSREATVLEVPHDDSLLHHPFDSRREVTFGPRG